MDFGCTLDCSLVLAPLPQTYECSDQVIGIESEGSIKTLTVKYQHGCQACDYAQHPHGVFLPDFQDDVDDSCYQGEYFEDRLSH